MSYKKQETREKKGILIISESLKKLLVEER